MSSSLYEPKKLSMMGDDIYKLTVMINPIFFCFITAEKLRLQEELFRLKSIRKDSEAKKEHLLNRAKVLQARAMQHKAKVKLYLSNHPSVPEVFR